MKKESNLKRLLEYAGGYKYLTIASWILSALSALVALLPFVYIWKVIKEVLDVAPNYGEVQDLSHNGWMAVVFAVAAILIYIAALICSHLAAFRVQTNMRTKAMHHIVTLPMGFMDGIGSGKVRKTVYESSAATETYLAHQLPDKANALATPVGLIVLLLVFDWRLGLLSLLPVAAAFVIMSVMTGKRMAKKMEEYNNALGQMSNEAVEYVRGISVVKTFGQSVFSFRRFKEAIDNYEKWVIAYTKDLRFPMMCYTTLVNGIFAVLVAAALVMASGGVTNEFLLNLIYYIIITPIITLTLTKIMYASENKLIVADAMSRIDSILEMEPLPETDHPKHPKDNSVELSGVSFRYKDAERNALENISLTIKPGEHVAFVGPSGGGKTTLASIVARFWDVNSGSVKIGGINVKDIPKEELMDTVSFVFQDSKLLKTSILENVRIVGGIYFSIANAWDSIRRYLIALNSCTSINIYSYFSQCDLWNCGIKSQHMVSIILILLLSRCKLREFVQNADNFTLYLYRRCRNFVFFYICIGNGRITGSFLELLYMIEKISCRNDMVQVPRKNYRRFGSKHAKPRATDFAIVAHRNNAISFKQWSCRTK